MRLPGPEIRIRRPEDAPRARPAVPGAPCTAAMNAEERSVEPVRGTSIAWVIPVMAVWGSSYVVIKAGLRDTSPVFFAALRALPAGVLVLLLKGVGRRSDALRRPTARDALEVAILGSLCTALFFWGMFVGTPIVGAGLAAILINTQPFFVAVIAFFFLGERFGLKKTAFLVMGFGGVVLISWPRLQAGYSTDLFGVLSMLGAAFGFSVGLVLAKPLYRRMDLYWVTGWQLVVGGLELLLLAFFVEDLSETAWSARLLVSAGYLSVVGTAAASLLWFRLIRHHPVGVLASYAFLSPLFGLLLARLVYGEAFTAPTTLGMGLILLGLYGIRRPG